MDRKLHLIFFLLMFSPLPSDSIIKCEHPAVGTMTCDQDPYMHQVVHRCLRFIRVRQHFEDSTVTCTSIGTNAKPVRIYEPRELNYFRQVRISGSCELGGYRKRIFIGVKALNGAWVYASDEKEVPAIIFTGVAVPVPKDDTCLVIKDENEIESVPCTSLHHTICEAVVNSFITNSITFTKIHDPPACELTDKYGDGLCNTLNNIERCNYDAGDCCLPYASSALTGILCEATGQTNDIAGLNCAALGEYHDNVCDDNNNVADCNYDGGDCCLDIIDTSRCTNCVCHSDGYRHLSVDDTCDSYDPVAVIDSCEADLNSPECMFSKYECCTQNVDYYYDGTVYTGPGYTEIVHNPLFC